MKKLKRKKKGKRGWTFFIVADTFGTSLLRYMLLDKEVIATSQLRLVIRAIKETAKAVQVFR